MMLFLVGAVLQATLLPAETWKERNHPDMPRIGMCRLTGSQAIVTTINQLPPQVRLELVRFFGPVGGLSDANGPFNSTDVIDGSVPSRRFIRAYHVAGRWIIWYEKGGMFHNVQTLALTPSNETHDGVALYRATGDTTFAGDPCAATRAILSGVINASP